MLLSLPPELLLPRLPELLRVLLLLLETLGLREPAERELLSPCEPEPLSESLDEEPRSWSTSESLDEDELRLLPDIPLEESRLLEPDIDPELEPLEPDIPRSEPLALLPVLDVVPRDDEVPLALCAPEFCDAALREPAWLSSADFALRALELPMSASSWFTRSVRASRFSAWELEPELALLPEFTESRFLLSSAMGRILQPVCHSPSPMLPNAARPAG